MAPIHPLDLDIATQLLLLKDSTNLVPATRSSGKENDVPPPIPARSTRPTLRLSVSPDPSVPLLGSAPSPLQLPGPPPFLRDGSVLPDPLPMPANAANLVSQQEDRAAGPSGDQATSALSITDGKSVVAFLTALWTPTSDIAQARGKPSIPRSRPKEMSKINETKVAKIVLDPSREVMLKRFMQMHDIEHKYVIRPNGPPMKVAWNRMSCKKENAPWIEKDADWEVIHGELVLRCPLPPISVTIDLDVWAAGFLDLKRSRFEDTDRDREPNSLKETGMGAETGPGTKKPRIHDFAPNIQELGQHAQAITKEHWCATYDMVCFKRNGACLPITHVRMKLWCTGCINGTADYQNPPHTKEFDYDYVLQPQGMVSEAPTLRGRAKQSAAPQPVINIHVPPQPSARTAMLDNIYLSNSIAQFQRQLGNSVSRFQQQLDLDPLSQLNRHRHPAIGDALLKPRM
ncbi:hypothetical protein FRB90_005806 [Tulasnella sp. 427]|nr:hypothetical protein FRB90_005806 [Tulasnella sp. 427]